MCTRLIDWRVQLRDRRSSEHGFTLTELLVVVTMGGILAAIALPSFLSRASTAKQAEAKMYIGALNRAQQSYAAQTGGQFSDDPLKLGLVTTKTVNYEYKIELNSNYAVHHAIPQIPAIRPYVGMAAMISSVLEGSTVKTILCEANDPAKSKAPAPTITANQANVTCSDGTRSLQ